MLRGVRIIQKIYNTFKIISTIYILFKNIADDFANFSALLSSQYLLLHCEQTNDYERCKLCRTSANISGDKSKTTFSFQNKILNVSKQKSQNNEYYYCHKQDMWVDLSIQQRTTTTIAPTLWQYEPNHKPHRDNKNKICWKNIKSILVRWIELTVAGVMPFVPVVLARARRSECKYWTFKKNKY